MAKVKKVRGSKEGAKWAEIAMCHSVIAFCHETIAKAERRIRRLSSSKADLPR